MLLKYISFSKAPKPKFLADFFTFLCDRVMSQSLMTANCPLYIHLPITNDIYKGGFPKKLWDHKCLLACFLGDTPSPPPPPPLFHKHEMVKRPYFKTRLTSDLMQTHLEFFRRLICSLHLVWCSLYNQIKTAMSTITIYTVHTSSICLVNAAHVGLLSLKHWSNSNQVSKIGLQRKKWLK